ncbi:hypothetical protein EVAR_73499_1 [Eumeta japonica]|uniref:Uncharacterized protein n=1 Tax=Eumeta variegata TaxID=151549 RepID=A0A4C1SET2_EUMVA|nr:hypothetical protein EVAR_73499_1 [Eumeta japonica]
MYADPEFNLLPNMPFETIEDLREFDEKLPHDDALRGELKAFLIRHSGKDFTSFIRAALRAIVTDELADRLTKKLKSNGNYTPYISQPIKRSASPARSSSPTPSRSSPNPSSRYLQNLASFNNNS